MENASLKKFIVNSLHQCLNESFKLTFENKKEIDQQVRKEYDKYKDGLDKHNNSIKQALVILNYFKDKPEEDEVKKQFEYAANLPMKKPILYNQYYVENINRIKREYIAYKRRNSQTSFQYKPKNTNKLDKFNYDEYYQNLSPTERKNIKIFISIVAERVNSGTGESIDRKEVRDAFFKTPKSFQVMFSEKPSSYLWRGDYTHPCSDEYDHTDTNYLSMQSFTTQKSTAQEFGFNFNALNIKKYSGSFSLPLFLEYGDIDGAGFGDDEGEIMFFDVEYKCKKKINRDY